MTARQKYEAARRIHERLAAAVEEEPDFYRRLRWDRLRRRAWLLSEEFYTAWCLS